MVGRFLLAVAFADGAASVLSVAGVFQPHVDAGSILSIFILIALFAVLPLTVAMGVVLLVLDKSGAVKRLNHWWAAVTLGGLLGAVVRLPLLDTAPVPAGAIFGAMAGLGLWLMFRHHYARGAAA